MSLRSPILQEKELLAKISVLSKELEKVKNNEEEIIYKFSHDLQQPVTTIIGYLDLFRRRYDKQLDERGVAYLDNIQMSIDRLSDLLKELLVYSRVGSIGEVTEIDVKSSIEEAWKNLLSQDVVAELELDMDESPVVEANAEDISLLFHHVLQNGILYHEEGTHPQVRVEASLENQIWQFRVWDNGIGIPSGYEKKIFELFYRLHGSSEYPGGGIGLAICKKIVEKYKGEIWIESVEGSGSCVHFSLPEHP